MYGAAGLLWSPADLTDVDRLARDWPDGTAQVWIESPTNPRLAIVDIEAVAELAHERGAIVVVDNTFATPYLQQPLALGADVVVHSTTKYLGGHSDVVGGFAATNDPALADGIRFIQNAAGAVPSPFDCLPGAARREDARPCAWTAIATTPGRSSSCSRATRPSPQVLWPGLPSHPGHDVAKRQMRDFGGMVSFVCAGGEAGGARRGAHGPGCSRWPSRSGPSSR